MRTIPLFFEVLLFLLRAISTIRIDIFTGIIFIQNRLKNIAVVYRSVCYFIITHKLVLDIHLNMIFIAVKILAVFLYPAGISVFLPLFCI